MKGRRLHTVLEGIELLHNLYGLAGLNGVWRSGESVVVRTVEVL